MEDRRLSAAEKGKSVVSEPYQAPRKARVRVPEPENHFLLQKHSLTLIGRVTNPSTQKIWSLLPFFAEKWATETRPIGSDLGQGMFQFQFEKEEDLLTVLAKRPYQYARWMVIVERWNPTMAPDFPSLIPFWIKVQGIHVHLWTETTIKTIGEDIGIYEEAEITSLSARMRVQINGRLPLITKTASRQKQRKEQLLLSKKMTRRSSPTVQENIPQRRDEEIHLMAKRHQLTNDIHLERHHTVAPTPMKGTANSLITIVLNREATGKTTQDAQKTEIINKERPESTTLWTERGLHIPLLSGRTIANHPLQPDIPLEKGDSRSLEKKRRTLMHPREQPTMLRRGFPYRQQGKIYQEKLWMKLEAKYTNSCANTHLWQTQQKVQLERNVTDCQRSSER
ncbi:hypothetical protein Rs2_15558 [Raphanus sativus]|nr:hypothetical protein Rs2_15558 [Raphanus sativus]